MKPQKKAPPAKGKKKGSVISVDFTGVEAGGKCADGQYVCTVEEVTQETSDNSGEDYLQFILRTDEGNKKLYHMCSLQPQALWKLRQTLEAMGYEVPDGAMDLDFSDLVGEKIGVVVENEVYQGKKRPKVTDVMTPDEVNGEEAEEEETEEEAEESEEEEETEEEEEAQAPKKKAAKKKTSAFSVGQKVEFEDEGKTYKGKIKAIDDGQESATVTVGKDDWEISLSDLTAS